MPLDPEILRYVGVTAVLAGTAGQRKEALLAAEAALDAQPDNVEVQLLVANVKLGVGDAAGGAKLLREKILVAHPDRSIAKATLAAACSAMGMAAERDKLVQEVIDVNDDPDAVRLAQLCMERASAA